MSYPELFKGATPTRCRDLVVKCEQFGLVLQWAAECGLLEALAGDFQDPSALDKLRTDVEALRQAALARMYLG